MHVLFGVLWFVIWFVWSFFTSFTGAAVFVFLLAALFWLAALPVMSGDGDRVLAGTDSFRLAGWPCS
jgi:hypothetical protein